MGHNKKIKRITKIVVLDTFPDGEHPAVWSGYEIRCYINDNEYRIDTTRGFRGTFDCKLIVKDNIITDIIKD